MALSGRREPAERGSLLVEVLGAMAIFAMSLLALAPMFLLAARENAAAGDQTFATTLAHDKAEALKRLDYTLLASGTDRVKMRSMTYDRAWLVEDDTPHPGIRTVTVTVTPRRVSSHGGTRAATVRFYRVQ